MDTPKRGNRFIFILALIHVIVSISFGFILQPGDINHIESLLLSQVVLISIPIVIYFIITRANIKETLQLHRMDFISVLISIGVAILIHPLISFVNLLSLLVFENKISGAIMPLLELPLWLLLFLVAVLPAINEEFVLRGILLTNYKNVSIKKAALINGLCFGIIHMNGNQFSYAFVIGIILFYLVKVTGSIYSSIIVHLMINGGNMILQKLLIAMQKFLGQFMQEEMVMPSPEQVDKAELLSALPFFAVLTMFTLPLIFLLLRAAAKRNKKMHLFVKNEDRLGATRMPKLRVMDGYLIGSMVIFTLMVLLTDVLLPMLEKAGSL